MTDADAKVFATVTDLVRVCQIALDHEEDWRYWRGAVCGAFENAMDRYNEEIRRERTPPSESELDGD